MKEIHDGILYFYFIFVSKEFSWSYLREYMIDKYKIMRIFISSC